MRNVSSALFLCDEMGIIKQVSDSVEKDFGYPAEELLGKSMFSFINVEDHGYAHIRFKQIYDGIDDCMSKPVRVICKDGSVRLIKCNGENQLGNPEIGAMIINLLDVTEKEVAKEQLILSEKGLSQAQHIAHIGNWEVDFISKQSFWSDETFRIFGYEPGEITPTQEFFLKHVHPDDLEKVLEKIVTLQADNNQEGHYHRIIRKDGEKRWVYTERRNLKNSDGKITGMFGVHQDVHEQMQTEESLRESRLNLEKAFEIALIGTWRFDPVNEQFEWSESAANILGFREGSTPVNLEDYVELVHQSDQNNFLAAVEAKRENGGLFDIEYRTITDEGIKWIRAKSHDEYDDKGNRVSVIGIVQDITASKTVEFQLRKNEAQLSIAADIGKLGYWELDFEKGVFTFTDQFYSVFKTTVEEQGGYTMTPQEYSEKFFFPEDRELVAMEMEKAMFTSDPGFNRSVEHKIRYATGEEGYIAVHFFIVKDKNGKTVRSYGANQDITLHKLIEKRTRKALDDKITLLTEVHHRIKNNLAIVSGLLELQQMQSENEEVKAPLRQSINRISSIAMVHELIYQSEDLTSINIEEYLRKLVPAIKAALHSDTTKVSVKMNVEAIMMNINQAIPLGLMLNELLTNSFKYAFKGRERGNIAIELNKRGPQLSFSYTDNGIGISEEEKGSIESGLGTAIIQAQLAQLEAEYVLDTENKFLLEFVFRAFDKGAHGNSTIIEEDLTAIPAPVG